MVSKSLQVGPNRQFLFLKPILVAIFVTMARVYVKLIPDFYTWAILLTNQKDEIGKKQLSVFGFRGPNLPLNARCSLTSDSKHGVDIVFDLY